MIASTTRVVTMDTHQMILPILSRNVSDLKFACSSLDGNSRKMIHMKNKTAAIPHHITGVVSGHIISAPLSSAKIMPATKIISTADFCIRAFYVPSLFE